MGITLKTALLGITHALLCKRHARQYACVLQLAADTRGAAPLSLSKGTLELGLTGSILLSQAAVHRLDGLLLLILSLSQRSLCFRLGSFSCSLCCRGQSLGSSCGSLCSCLPGFSCCFASLGRCPCTCLPAVQSTACDTAVLTLLTG